MRASAGHRIPCDVLSLTTGWIMPDCERSNAPCCSSLHRLGGLLRMPADH
jgi:hypothetical protein